MKKYKFELIRVRVMTGATKELETITNEYSKKGCQQNQIILADVVVKE